MNRKIKNIFNNWGVRLPNNRISNIEKLENGVYEITLKNDNNMSVIRKIDNETDLIQRVTNDIDVYEEGNDRLIKELSEVSNTGSIACSFCDQLYTDDDIGHEIYEMDDTPGEYVCNDCYSEYVYSCELCSKILRFDNGGHFIEGVGYYVCDSCYDESGSFEYCVACEAFYKISRGHYRGDASDTWYCNRCSERYLWQCSDCDLYYHRDDNRHELINGRQICDSCYDGEYNDCDWCGLSDKVDNMIPLDGYQLCSQCINVVFQCSQCKRLDKIENKHTINGKDYCRVCTEELIHDADNKEEFKSNRKFESVLINESADVESKLLSIFTKYGYDVPEETNILSVKPHEDTGYLLVRKIEKDGREKLVKLKISKILSDFFPGIDLVGDQRVQDMINEIKAVSDMKKNPYEFEVYNEISYWYKELYLEYGIDSCVVWDGRAENGTTDKILHGLDNNPNIKIVVIKEKSSGNYIGRALLWDGVTENEDEPLGAPYLDRTYPSGVDKIHGLFIQWADEQGYFHMDSMSHDGYVNGSKRKLSFDMKQVAEDVKIFPYMDSFHHAIVDLETEHVVLYDYLPDFYHDEDFRKRYKFYDLENQRGTDIEIVYYCYACGTTIKKDGVKYDYNNGNYLCAECIKDFEQCEVCDIMGRYVKGETDFHRGHINKLKGKLYCVGCAKAEFGYCRRCGIININGNTNIHDVIGKDMWGAKKHVTVCTSCRDSVYPKCHICGEHSGFGATINGKNVCQFCIKTLPKCSKCGQYKNTKDLRWRKKDIATHYCEDCWEDQESKYSPEIENEIEQLRKMRVFYPKYDDLKPELKKQIDTEYPGIIIEKHIQDYYTNFLKEGKYEN